MSQSRIEQWLNVQAARPDESARRAAERRQATLTKPPGSLGDLESIAVDLAGCQASEQPSLERVHITVFAGDHGVALEQVSAFPQAVTAEMVRNFAAGGAAISVAADAIGARLAIVNLGTVADTDTDTDGVTGVTNRHLGPGTHNLATEPAMTADQLVCALDEGWAAVERAGVAGLQLFIGGEMGIANTTAASALACALLDASPTDLTGPGTGLDAEALPHKLRVIQRALDLHHGASDSPIEMLRCLGGFEIAALAGAYLCCAQQGIVVLVDGFISSVAALVAVRVCPEARDWLMFSHTSAEPGHQPVLDALDARPLLDLSMRLGEGSGAATAVPLLRLACRLHGQMATFADAQVSAENKAD